MAALRSELASLVTTIELSKREIAAIKPGEGNCLDPGAAHGELALAVDTTEQAATDILKIAERLHQLENELKSEGVRDALCTEVGVLATSLMLACSFQDISGQRIAKVTKALKHIEKSVAGLVAIWRNPHAPQDNAIRSIGDLDDLLMNGPSGEGQGISQLEIDRILEK